MCATHRTAFEQLEEALLAACFSCASWPESVAAAVAAALQFAADEPAATTLIAFAPLAGDSDLTGQAQAASQRLLAMLRAGRERCPDASIPSDFVERALLFGAVNVIGAELLAGRSERLAQLAPELTEILLAPYLGPGKPGLSHLPPRHDGPPDHLHSSRREHSGEPRRVGGRGWAKNEAAEIAEIEASTGSYLNIGGAHADVVVAAREGASTCEPTPTAQPPMTCSCSRCLAAYDQRHPSAPSSSCLRRVKHVRPRIKTPPLSGLCAQASQPPPAAPVVATNNQSPHGCGSRPRAFAGRRPRTLFSSGIVQVP